MTSARRTAAAAAFALGWFICAVHAPAGDWQVGERIVDFHSHIEVSADGGLRVTETIAALAAGDEIKRGIYRDFPTLYRMPLWSGGPENPFAEFGGGPLFSYSVEVPFDVYAVERNGQPESYHIAETANGLRVYIGAESVQLTPGHHVYRIQYGTARQIGFFAEHDELYWNVTGNGWIFPIDRASATVILPAAIPRDEIRVEGYTGAQGAMERHLTAAVETGSGSLQFATTRGLDRYEGLTIVAAFPSGFIAAPSPAQRRGNLLRANPIFLYGPLGLAVVLLYYAGAWWRVGRDPRRGTIIPLFEPPLDVDAAGMRYIAAMKYDDRCFAAALVGLAARGWARIEEADGAVTLIPDDRSRQPLGAGERAVHKALLGNGPCVLQQANHRRVGAAITALRDALRREYEGTMFRANRAWAVPGMVLSVAVVLAAGFSGRFEQSAAFAFMLVWLSLWTAACLHLGGSVGRAWRDAMRPDAGVAGRGAAIVVALLATAMAVPFFAGELFGLAMLIAASSVWMGFLLVVLAATNFAFYHLLKQPTLAGRTVMDQIDSFKMYLKAAAGDELALAAPARTPELFDRMLPFAIALDVENQWAEQFADVLRSASTDGSDGYRTNWYSGSLHRLPAQRFASALTSSLATHVSSAASAPGSRSGSGGGGSSGGGGGGGGGGGW